MAPETFDIKDDLISFLNDCIDFAVINNKGVKSDWLDWDGNVKGIILEAQLDIHLDKSDREMFSIIIDQCDQFMFLCNNYLQGQQLSVFINLYYYSVRFELTGGMNNYYLTFFIGTTDKYVLQEAYFMKNYVLVYNILLNNEALRSLKSVLDKQKHVGIAKEVLIAVVNENCTKYPCLKPYLSEKDCQENFYYLETTDDFDLLGGHSQVDC